MLQLLNWEIGVYKRQRSKRRPVDSVEKDHICPVLNCGRQFYYKKHLNRHIKDKHTFQELRDCGYMVSFNK